ncbi:hypothetical protein CLAFUW4_11245 [Fulvia fulva]|nr:hypothetical protein CLAFUR4_11251 [Fulvia fulva]KAK4620718.1 hypothetical protein CLAFUR0_11256 [Fulvia fulva]WPV17571.1 hypothetical protein CLAFUW4_11245 [Fulvia fulva]WPV31969.1 hypothetical protein CLAFUW7_11241 [Fulvia fulva]
MFANNKFSIAKDPSWAPKSARASLAPSTSVYSDVLNEPLSRVDHPDMPHIPPLRVSKAKVGKPSQVPDHMANGHQQIQDNGPQVRQSRLPIFKQVRSMLQKPSPLTTSEAIGHNDTFRQTGRAPDVKPSNYKDAYEATDEAQRRPSPTRLQKNVPPSLRSTSPVSVLEDRDTQHERLPRFDWDPEPGSPISSTSDISPDYYQIPIGPSQVSVNLRAVPQTPARAKMVSIKRKAKPSGYSQASENIPPPPPPPYDSHYTTLNSWRNQIQPNSHFSWTTGAPSIRPASRPSMDGTNPAPRHSKDHGDFMPNSRFSWSTVQTGMRPESPPPSPPPVVPSKYRQPPVQSILSRHRPIQRADKEVWTPPPRKTSLADPEIDSGTPTSARSKLTINSRPFTEHDNAGSGKKLPPPPELLTPTMSHKEVLLKEEQDKIHQRQNIERAIADLSKIENASPMDVSWEQVKDARSRIAELKTTLAEVQMEEREIGVAITRARRKEGEEEGLWVRRVTS